MADNEGLDYNKLGEELKKAGIATQDSMRKDMDDYFAKFKDSEQSINGPEDDLGKHLRGECGNPDCEIAKEAQSIYDTAYKHGLFHGTKLGGYAAKKGIFV